MAKRSFMLFLVFFLSSCATPDDNDHTGTVCRQLKSNIIFNGKTSDIRKAEIQNSETPLNQSNFHNNRCEERRQY